MAWTSPRTWTTGELVTAAQFNTQIRDNLNATGVALVTTKGDITPATGASALDRLGVGANNATLLADSACTVGMKWGEYTGVLMGPADGFEGHGTAGRSPAVESYMSLGGLTEYKTWAYDATNELHGHGSIIWPQGTTTITSLSVLYAMSVGGSAVVWEMRLGVAPINESFSSCATWSVNVACNAPATASQLTSLVFSPCLVTASAGLPLNVQIARLANGASDTATGVMHILGVKIK